VVTVVAPAKINLTLEVIRKLPDGFHEIRSILQAIDLCDTLYIEAGQGISFTCDMQGWSAEKSLLNKTVALLRETTGCQKGAAVKIDKQIPLISGLGGDTSDAVALLKGLNEFWDLKLGADKLTSLAAWLGSDAAFFTKGGTALAAGRGEKLTPLPVLNKMWFVLVMPDVPVEIGKTGRMYAGLKPADFSDGSITQKAADNLNQGKPFKPSMLFNAFEDTALADISLRSLYIEPLLKMGALHVHLAGSGPTIFTVFAEKSRAEEIFHKCKSAGMKARLAQTL
jgi:4-diphosphocytidyl-2-C-methyl-D-erythritol kinase